MLIASRRAALAYRIAWTLVTVLALGRVCGLLTGSWAPGAFAYFTVLSNALVLVWAVAQTVRTAVDLRRDGPRGASTVSARGTGYVTMAILTTMLVYCVLLAPLSFTMGDGAGAVLELTNLLVHVVVPLLAIGDYLLFGPKGTFRAYDPLCWALVPYAYLVFAFVRAEVGGPLSGGGMYPYPFMDVDALGWGAVAVNLVGITVALEVVAYGLFWVDRALGQRARGRVAAP
ncbi:Pr6Pr family membrane protein [Isoptericola sp. F-RaC21]|uniref:Pr6Pr family membrane protein n=1 Tax=Isoptericola sp. F-RaC21 TaxID=3141452 RepID=UPI00315B9463